MVISVDALFGLPRKKAAGISHREPLHGSLFFGDQLSVDEYVASYTMPSQTSSKVSEYSSIFLVVKVCNVL